VPLRLELGPRDAAKQSVMAVNRIDRSKTPIPVAEIAARIPELLEQVQKNLYDRALRLREDNTRPVDDYGTFRSLVAEQGGFLNAFWCGKQSCEEKVQEETKATIRVVPMEESDESGTCIYCGRPAKGRVTFARAY
jgi:prolyl-tRNA synthetase